MSEQDPCDCYTPQEHERLGHTAENGLPPTRLCCGQRHYGVVCLDGMVMCCLCFERVTVADLHDEDGRPVNVCRPCADAEATRPIPPEGGQA